MVSPRNKNIKDKIKGVEYIKTKEVFPKLNISLQRDCTNHQANGLGLNRQAKGKCLLLTKSRSFLLRLVEGKL